MAVLPKSNAGKVKSDAELKSRGEKIGQMKPGDVKDQGVDVSNISKYFKKSK